jgi:hypothetical protein
MTTFLATMLLLTLKKQDFVQHFLFEKLCYNGLDPDLDPEPDPKLYHSRIRNRIRDK